MISVSSAAFGGHRSSRPSPVANSANNGSSATRCQKSLRIVAMTQTTPLRAKLANIRTSRSRSAAVIAGSVKSSSS